MPLAPMEMVVDHKRVVFPQFDLGIIDNVSPTDPRLAGRAALFARNVNYDRRTIARRGGIQRICENAPGAAQVSSFEPSETWSPVGASLSTADTTNFVTKEVAGTGTQSRKLEVGGGGGEVVAGMSRTGLALNLAGNAMDVFSIWLYPNTLFLPYHLRLIFRTSVGNQFEAILADSVAGPLLTVGVPLYHRIKRYSFSQVGTPSWANITEIEISLTFTSAPGNIFSVSADNLTLGPGRGQDLIQFRRLSDPTYKGAKDEYAVLDGRLYRLDEVNQVWINMGLFFDPDAEVNHIVFNDRLYLCDGVSKNRKVMPNGTSVFQMGIDNFTSPITTVQVAGGGSLDDGDHFIAVTYYSTITGVESAPHSRDPGHKMTIVAGGGDDRIQYSGIPASTDPQVTHVRIYRLSPTSTVFRRVSQSTDGEIVNGATTYLEGVADSQMGDELDPDLDAPKPSKFFTSWPELGVLLASFSDTPSVVNISSPADGAGPENWPVDLAVAVGRDDNDIVSGLHYDGIRALCFKPNAILEGFFVGGDEFIRFRTIKTDRGSMSHKGILSVENRVYYPGSDGVYALAQDNSVRKTTNLQQNTWNELVFRERLNRACATQVRARYQYLLYFNSKGFAQNDLAWKLHHNSVLVDRSFDKGLGPGHTAATSIDDQSAMAATEVEMSGEVRETWVLSADGQVYRIDTGISDDGAAYRSRHRTALLSPSGGDLLHSFVFLELELRQSSASSLTVRAWHDYSVGDPSASLLAALSGAGAQVLGASTFILGTSHLGASYAHRKKIRLPPKSARWILFEFEQAGVADFEIYKANLWHETDGQP
jgi:hypothetical protein